MDLHGSDWGALEIAQREIEERFLGGNVHTVCIGPELRGGVETGRLAVVIEVSRKLSGGQAAVLSAGFDPIPAAVDVDGWAVPTDVQQASQHRIELLEFPETQVAGTFQNHQLCMNSPVGGVQIAPAGRQWVGTAGCCVWSERHQRFGALTNWHVAESPRGTRILQPGPGSDHIGVVAELHPIRFGGEADNYVDAAFIDCRQNRGGQHVDMFRPYLLGLQAVPLWQTGRRRVRAVQVLEATIGLPAAKSGRTTGVTYGRVSGLNATSIVNFGNGRRALFRGQLRFSGDNGDFSRPGDSGSLIVERGTLRPVALLFAGGGGSTLGNPAGRVADALKIRYIAGV